MSSSSSSSRIGESPTVRHQTDRVAGFACMYSPTQHRHLLLLLITS